MDGEGGKPVDLQDLVESVKDQATFISFVNALAEDFELELVLEAAGRSSLYSPGKLGWENGTIDEMLEAAAAWGSASSDAWLKSGDTNVWRRCAHILLAGKFYE